MGCSLATATALVFFTLYAKNKFHHYQLAILLLPYSPENTLPLKIIVSPLPTSSCTGIFYTLLVCPPPPPPPTHMYICNTQHIRNSILTHRKYSPISCKVVQEESFVDTSCFVKALTSLSICFCFSLKAYAHGTTTYRFPQRIVVYHLAATPL